MSKSHQIDVIEQRSSDSAAMLPYWDKTDTIVEGYDAIKLAGEKFLPKFENEETKSYKLRLELTKFTNVYRDIIESLSSKPFETPITVENAPSKLEAILNDIDGGGNDLTVFSTLMFFNALNSGLHWIFIDYPNAQETQAIKTQADQKAAGVRSYWSHVLARNILEAKWKVINGKETLVYIRIYEPKGSPTGKDQIRIFSIIEGIVIFEVYEKQEKFDDEKQTAYIRIENGNISISIIPLVPFFTGRRDGRGFKVFPMMRDASDLQIDLYQQESGLKYITTIAAYPMLAANGMKPELGPDGRPKPLNRGPSTVLYGTPDGNGNHGNWAFIEPSSQSMTFLASNVAATKQDLRELGRQPLTAQSGNLTVITTAVAAGKAKSALAALVVKMRDVLEQALMITAMWENAEIPEQMEVKIFDEFDDYLENEKDLTALLAIRKDREISHETFISEMKARKVLSAGVNSSDELEKLLSEIPNDNETANANG